MGSRPTLAPTPTRPPTTPHPDHDKRSGQKMLDQPHIRDDQQPDPEQAFDRLNPDYGVPADTHNRHGHQAMQERETALALGTRVAVGSSRENDRNPVMWLAGQDYRAADAARTARLRVVRQRHGPQRVGPER